MIQPQWQTLYCQFAHTFLPTRIGVLQNTFAPMGREMCVARTLLC